MNQIKFRAWVNGGEDHDYNHVMTYDLAFEEYAPINKLLNDINEGGALMQFTGKLTAHGEEIYDGDIIRFHFRIKDGRVLEFTGKIVWDQYMWLVQTQEGDVFSLNRIHNCIILGNIHET